MKKNVKKIIGAIIASAMIITEISNFAHAETSSTVADNNDTSSNAIPINSAGAATGVLSSDDDVDFYKYTVDVTGYYNFTFRDTTETGKTWRLSVYDSSLVELESDTNDEYTLRTNTYDFKKGDVLYLKVADSNRTQGKEYSISVNATTASDWEQEHNDTKTNATIIKSNSSVYGNMYSEDDIDFYKYKVDVTGYYNFTFKDTTESGKTWKISVYDSSLNELESYTNDEYTLTTNTYNFKKGTVLYLKVVDSNRTWGKEYSLTVNAEKNANWEQEKDDSYSKAIALKTNTSKYGNLYYANDVDFYTFTAAKTGSVKTTVSLDTSNVGCGWKVTIYDSSKKEIKTVTDITADKTISFKATKKKKYYVVVKSASNYSSPISITYALKIK